MRGSGFALAAVVLAACAAAPRGASTADRSADLLAAVKGGDAAATRALLEGGADANARGDGGDSALMLAVLYGDAALVKLLLSRGADPRLANASGATALHWAVDDRAKMDALLAGGADVNATTEWGFTPLMAAAVRDDSAEAVSLLLEHGADVNRATGTQLTAIILASGGDTRAVQALLERGADPGAKVNSGHSALHAAARLDDPANARLLVAGGADVNALDGMRRTPLMWAAQMRARDVVTLLLEHGADPNGSEEFSGTTA